MEIDIKMRLLTTDLYEGAWLLSQGVELVSLWMDQNHKRSIIFEFSGAEVEHLKQAYQRGQAKANVIQLKQSINVLKDRMFEKLREERWRNTNDPSFIKNG